MAERQERPKLIFKKFLKDNQKILKKLGSSKAEKYIRDPWMMKASPSADKTEEILRKEAEGFSGNIYAKNGSCYSRDYICLTCDTPFHSVAICG